MNTPEGVLAVIGDLRVIVEQKEAKIQELQIQVNDLAKDNSHLRNSVRHLSENLLKDTIPNG